MTTIEIITSLFAGLEQDYAASTLPEAPSAKAAPNDLLVRLRVP